MWNFRSLLKFLCVITALLSLPAYAAVGPGCKQHPLYKNVGQCGLIQSWTFAKRSDGRMNWPTSGYFARYSLQTWAQEGKPASTKYVGLDYFVTSLGKGKKSDYVTLHFQRPAKIYLMVRARIPKDIDQEELPKMRGWKSEDWVRKVSGPKYTVIGINSDKRNMYAPNTAFVFSIEAESVTLGTAAHVKSLVKGIPASHMSGSWSLLIAEESGKPVPKPPSPKGMTIEANKYCPPELHNLWVTEARDSTDPDMKTKNGSPITFPTYHPLWDPIYWCAYDHEHGSNAKKIMGYDPMYGYTARKNGNEAESHRGFKDIVLDTPKYWIYYSIHAHMSSPRRFETRFHTKTIAAVNKLSKELELELTFKADYGHRDVRLANRKRVPINDDDAELAEETDNPRRARTFNIIKGTNRAQLDKRYSYRPGIQFIHGQYEQWKTKPICSSVNRGGEPEVDIRNMAFAMKTAAGTETTLLGRFRDKKLVPQTSQNRRFRAKYFKLSDKLCQFALPDIFGVQTDGKFYTDVYGAKLYSTPSVDRVAQYIKEGFAVEITGDFDTEETWDGIYVKGGKGSFKDVGKCLLYNKN